MLLVNGMGCKFRGCLNGIGGGVVGKHSFWSGELVILLIVGSTSMTSLWRCWWAKLEGLKGIGRFRRFKNTNGIRERVTDRMRLRKWRCVGR